MSRVIGVPAELVPAAWESALAHLERALVHTHECFEAEDVLEALLRRDMQLWVSLAGDNGAEIEAAVVTEIVRYPRRKACRVFLVGGRRLRDWLRPMNALLESFARAHGCDFMEGGARRGWARAAGYREIGVVLAKSLRASAGATTEQERKIHHG